jgi:hypothetical protein
MLEIFERTEVIKYHYCNDFIVGHYVLTVAVFFAVADV